MKKIAILGSTFHQCKKSTGNTPHVGGPALQTNNDLLFINDQPTLVKGDMLLCNAPNMPTVSEGSSLLFINSRAAAMEEHSTSHDSKLKGGSNFLLVEQ